MIAFVFAFALSMFACGVAQASEVAFTAYAPAHSEMNLAFIFLAALLFLIGLTFVQRLRMTRLSREISEIQDENESHRDLLSSSPDGYYYWRYDEKNRLISESCSRRLAVLLRLYNGKEAAWPEILSSFAESEASILDCALSGARENQQDFHLKLPLKNKKRTILIFGQIIKFSSAAGHAIMVWMRDVSEETLNLQELDEKQKSIACDHQRLKIILDALPMPVWLRDADLSLVYCNQAYVKAIGVDSAERAITHKSELASGNDMRHIRAVAARARAALEPQQETFSLVLDGELRSTLITETPIQDSLGRLMTVGCARDCSHEKDLTQQIDRHIRAHSNVLERLATAIAIFSADMKLIFFNQAFIRLWGLDRDTLSQNPSYSHLLDMLRERRRLPEVADFKFYKHSEMAKFTSIIAPSEDVLHLPDGTTLRRVCAPHPFGGLLFTYEDITDSLALERSYNTLIAVQRETLDHLHEGITVFGADGRLKIWNPAYRQMWQFELEDIDNQPHCKDILERKRSFFSDTAHWQTMRNQILSLFTDPGSHHGRIDRRGGVALDYSGLSLPDGSVLVIWLDISDTVQVEQALWEKNQGLAAADHRKNQFIANVSTAVKRPLETIIGFAETLAQEYYGPLNTRQMEYCRQIGENSRNLLSLTADISDLAAIEAGKNILRLGVVDIHPMLLAILSLLREKAREKRVILHFDCPIDIGWMVADELRLRHILFHLLNNAITFTPAEGQITLACQREGQIIIFTIADTGIGMDESEQKELFHPFKHDSGLGLTLVKRFTELHGGWLEIASVKGEGTTFSCHLPAGKNNAKDLQKMKNFKNTGVN